MRIAYLAAGAGNTYCGACARDAVLVRALSRAGHDIHMIPLYTPLKMPDDDIPLEPIFFGGLNVFLQQSSALFRHLPKSLDRILDHPALLRLVSKFSIEVDPKRLGPMTVSVLAGKNGRQKKEVDRLLAHLERQPRPDLVHLTNSLLSSLAPEIKRRLSIPIICSFQGEDLFVRDLPEKYSTQALDLIRTHAQSIDLFICPNEIMLPHVADFLAVPPDRLRVIRTAVEIPPPPPSRPQPPQTFTIGYLSAIRPVKGLDILLDALRILTQMDPQSRPAVRLLIAGRTADPPYWQSIQKTLHQSKLENRNSKIPLIDYLGELTPTAKTAFFHRCNILALPSRIPEPRGVVALEAMAASLPVLVPATGIFPELLHHGGGLLVHSLNPADWADTLATLARNPAHLAELSTQARAAISTHHSPTQMAAQTLDLYTPLLSNQNISLHPTPLRGPS